MNAWARLGRVPPVFLVGIGILLIAVAGSFYLATTFIGDDHLFLAFARYAPNPLAPFIRDQHGGEFYRPLPMVVWWVLGNLAGGSKIPFAALSFVLHLAVSLEVGLLVRAAGDRERDRDASGRPTTSPRALAAAIAALLFFVAPATQEAAFWYSASTDLFATAFGVGTILALLHQRVGVATLLFVAACWSKETALIVPALAAVALHGQAPVRSPHEMSRRLLPLGVVAAIYLLARGAVLRGLGHSGEQGASLGGKLLQLASGVLHLPVGSAIGAEPLASIVAFILWGLMALAILRPRFRRKGGGGAAGSPRGSSAIPLAWLSLALLPLLAASWAVGARYYYLPAVGLAWCAAEILARRKVPLLVAVLAGMTGLSFAQYQGRRTDVLSYETRLAAARRAVADGLAHGTSTFQVAAGIKDLDLAVKEDPRFADHEGELLVLGDVPSSFVAVPESRAAAAEFLLARPPLPPSGAYMFGARRVVGLARRGDDPTLDEVVARLPDIRFIRLRLGPAGRIIFRDVTESMRDAGESGTDSE